MLPPKIGYRFIIPFVLATATLFAGGDSDPASLAEKSDRKAATARQRLESVREELASITGNPEKFQLPQKAPQREVILRTLMGRYQTDAEKWTLRADEYRRQAKAQGAVVAPASRQAED